MSGRAVINIVVLLIVLPIVVASMTRDDSTSTSLVDLRVSRMSVVLLILGSLALGFSSTVPEVLAALLVFTFGSGFCQATQSFITSLVEPDQVARLYTIIAAVDGVGLMLGAALLNQTLQLAIRAGGITMGLPFLVVASLYTVTGLAIWYI